MPDGLAAHRPGTVERVAAILESRPDVRPGKPRRRRPTAGLLPAPHLGVESMIASQKSQRDVRIPSTADGGESQIIEESRAAS